MTSFDDRRDAFEKKFAHDEDLRFRATARRNKMIGLWAAERLGKTGADAQVYATEVVTADFEEAGDGDVIRKLTRDLDSGGAPASEADIRAKLDEFLAKAVADIQTGS